MAKTKLGFDIGNHSVKIAAVSASRAEVHDIRMPDNMVQDGEIVMPTAFADFLKKESRKLNIHRGECALALPARQVICRTVTMPRMTEEQLLLNLPYEFNEFIEGDPDRFICDYALCGGDDGESEQMTMVAAAASKSRVGQYVRVFSDAGFKLKTLLPGEMAIINLVKKRRTAHPDSENEYCVVNLGHDVITITIVNRDRLQATRQLDFGCRRIDQAIADVFDTDPFLANSYKRTNYQNVLYSRGCMDVYQSIAVEALKVVNFYRYNYRSSQLTGIYLAGGGAAIEPLRERIGTLVDMPILPLRELLPWPELDPASAATGILALGMTV